MTVGEILADAKGVFAEFGSAENSARTKISDVQWVLWLDEYQEEAAIMTKNPRTEATATSDSTSAYDTPADFLAMVYFEFKKNGEKYTPLRYVPFELMITEYGNTWRDDDAGVPEAFTLPTQEVFELHPKPNSANQGASFMRMNYVYRPVKLSAKLLDNSPVIHAAYHRTAKYFLGSKAHEYIGNPNMADRLMNSWVEAMKGRTIGRRDLIEGKVKTAKIFRWG